VLHYDRENLMPGVVWVLKQAVPGTGLKRAPPITYEAHPNGRAVAKRCHKELAKLYKNACREGTNRKPEAGLPERRHIFFERLSGRLEPAREGRTETQAGIYFL
jgi:ATP-dependent Clp protease adaptor protein ClpS